MNEPFQHPLDKIYPNNSLLLLEAMIPYVDPSLKLPLAMLIKIQELRILMQVLNNPSQMDACGLNRGSGNMDELLNALCKAMGFDFMEQMNTMQNMMNTMNTMNAMQEAYSTEKNASENHPFEQTEQPQNSFFEEQPSSPPETAQEFASETKNDMIDAIRQILSEQEGEPYES